jgi:hypothetical protein
MSLPSKQVWRENRESNTDFYSEGPETHRGLEPRSTGRLYRLGDCCEYGLMDYGLTSFLYCLRHHVPYISGLLFSYYRLLYTSVSFRTTTEVSIIYTLPYFVLSLTCVTVCWFFRYLLHNIVSFRTTTEFVDSLDLTIYLARWSLTIDSNLQLASAQIFGSWRHQVEGPVLSDVLVSCLNSLQKVVIIGGPELDEVPLSDKLWSHSGIRFQAFDGRIHRDLLKAHPKHQIRSAGGWSTH